MKILQLIFVSFFIMLCSGYLAPLSAQDKPDWVERKGVSPWISENQFVTGFGLATLTKKDNPEEIKKIAEENAKKNLAEKIRVKVKSVTRTYKEQTDLNFEQKLESEIISLTNIEFPGLKKDFYVDSKEGFAYCMVYVPRNHLIKTYEYKIFELSKELEGIFYSAQEYENNEQKTTALEKYLQCYPLSDEIYDLKLVLMGLGESPDYESPVTKYEINQAMSRLVTSIKSLNDLAFFVAYAFQEQLQEEKLSGIIVSPLTYRNTGISSAFSKQFRESVEHYLVTQNRWETFPLKKYDPSLENMLKIRYAVKGKYWETEEAIHINIYLSEILTGIKKASIEYELDRAMVDEEFLKIKPENHEQVLKDQRQFEINEVSRHGLRLDAYTNKGRYDLLFTEGEEMEITVVTNMPCYLQLIYHLHDSSRVLFLNNEYVDVTEVDKPYELPFVFTCSPPFGVETLQINASEAPFPEMDTYFENGLNYIQEDLSSILRKTRHDSMILQDEVRMTITTMPN